MTPTFKNMPDTTTTDSPSPSSPPPFIPFSFVCKDSDFSDEVMNIAIVTGSRSTSDNRSVTLRVETAIRKWLATEQGADCLDECGGAFTLYDLAEYFYPPIEELLIEQGLIDFRIELHEIIQGTYLLDEPLNLVGDGPASVV
jgi:hypothetical protein